MSAMEEAFARIGVKMPRYPTMRQQPAPTIPRQPIKERLVEDRAAYAAMSDDDLAFEAASLAENLEAVRLELRLDSQGDVDHPADWRVRAERAAAILRGRASLCRVEMDKRKGVVAEQNRAHEERSRQARAEQAEQRRHDADLAHQRKVAIIAASAVRESGERDAFIRHARALLPWDTFAAIWAAVRAERGGNDDL